MRLLPKWGGGGLGVAARSRCLVARHPSSDRFTVNSVDQVSAHVLSHTRLQPAHKEPKAMGTGRCCERAARTHEGFRQAHGGMNALTRRRRVTVMHYVC